MRSVGYVVALAVLWVLLWGSASPANVLSGLAVGALLVVVLSSGQPPRRGRVVVRPVAVARLVGSVLVGAVRSNALLTRQILKRRPELTASVEAFDLPAGSDELVTLIANLLAVTPGALPLEASADRSTLMVHVLLLESPERTRASIEALMRRSADAFGPESP